MMGAFSLLLERGQAFPAGSFWPDSAATIPISSEHFTASKDRGPDQQSVVLYGRRGMSQEALLWVDSSGALRSGVDIESWIISLQQELYRPAHRPPLSSRLFIHYHFIPGWIRNVIARILLKRKDPPPSHPSFPDSINDVGCQLFMRLATHASGRSFEKQCILTHDIDTARGLDWIDPIAALEEKHGYRSLWNYIPYRYRIDENHFDRLRDRGHEIGVHGFWHDNSEAFLKPVRFREILDSLQPQIERFKIRSYRGPSWYRTPEMFDALMGYFDFDLTCPDVDLMCPGYPGGVGLMLPFEIRPGLTEIPCTLPFDLFLLTGSLPEALPSLWEEKLRAIEALGGLLVVNTHPDPNYLGSKRLLKVYEHFLQNLASSRWKGMLPSQLNLSKGS